MGDSTMKVSPFHTSQPARPPKRDVYHNNTSCTEGNNIERQYRRDGTAGRPLCDRCENL